MTIEEWLVRIVNDIREFFYRSNNIEIEMPDLSSACNLTESQRERIAGLIKAHVTQNP
jgi:elongation factor P--beta-lysine ligase